MKIKLNQQYEGYKEPTLFSDNEKKIPLLLRDTIMDSLLVPWEKDTPKQKYDKWEMYTRIKAGKDEIELTVEEIASIKQYIGNVIKFPLIVGQSWRMLEGKNQ